MKRIRVDYGRRRVRLVDTLCGKKIFPAGWVGTVEYEEKGGDGQRTLWVVWDETGDECMVTEDKVEFI